MFYSCRQAAHLHHAVLLQLRQLLRREIMSDDAKMIQQQQTHYRPCQVGLRFSR